MATSYTEYKWRGLIFTFKSTSADLVNGTNQSLGTVTMATEYDTINPPFTDKRQMANYQYSNSTKPSQSAIHAVETAKKMTQQRSFYIRDRDQPNGDIRLYDIGRFTLATDGMQGTTGSIGELWVSYEIEFLKPRLTLDAGIETDVYYLPPTPDINDANPFGIPSATRIYSVANPIRPYYGTLNTGLTDSYAFQFPFDSVGKYFQIQYFYQGQVNSVGNRPTFDIVQVASTEYDIETLSTYNYGPLPNLSNGLAFHFNPPTVGIDVFVSCIVLIKFIKDVNKLPTMHLQQTSAGNYPVTTDMHELRISEINASVVNR